MIQSQATKIVYYPIALEKYPFAGGVCGDARSFYGCNLDKSNMLISAGLWLNSGILSGSGSDAVSTNVFAFILAFI